MATGNLKTWFVERGFGFIKDDASSGPDIFMHISALLGSGINPDDLKTGDRLSYDIAPAAMVEPLRPTCGERNNWPHNPQGGVRASSPFLGFGKCRLKTSWPTLARCEVLGY